MRQGTGSVLKLQFGKCNDTAFGIVIYILENYSVLIKSLTFYTKILRIFWISYLLNNLVFLD